MAFSRFGSVRLGAGQVHTHGPVSEFPPDFKVGGFFFVFVQGDVLVGGTGRVGTDAWEGKADAGDLEPGDALGIGVLLMVDPGFKPQTQMVTWSETVLVE
jgi:hypothetical protein